ncbi:hypothetical protein LTR28_012135 [Elasticomyces elasticus]|nr:hypothetical protein LTR28_012428 [Elasticomyces elasticus]KAK5001867.1 hypothetical protein LTR28_012135 [Elasticomyces elasticus]
MGWLTNNLAPHYVRATGTGAQIMVANCAAFIATFTYLSKDAPRFHTGHAINIGMLCFSLLITSTMLVYTSWENRKRARGGRDYRLTDGKVEQGMLGYRHPNFKYTL